MRKGMEQRKAKQFYEEMMFQSLKEAWRVLKPDSPLVMVYAHKTTAGWSTLVEALKKNRVYNSGSLASAHRKTW